MYIHVLMRDEKEGRSKEGQTNKKAKQHSTPKAVTFPKKNDMYMYMYVNMRENTVKPNAHIQSRIVNYNLSCIGRVLIHVNQTKCTTTPLAASCTCTFTCSPVTGVLG